MKLLVNIALTAVAVALFACIGLGGLVCCALGITDADDWT